MSLPPHEEPDMIGDGAEAAAASGTKTDPPPPAEQENDWGNNPPPLTTCPSDGENSKGPTRTRYSGPRRPFFVNLSVPTGPKTKGLSKGPLDGPSIGHAWLS